MKKLSMQAYLLYFSNWLFTYSATTGELRRRLSNHNGFLKPKDSQVFCKWINNIHEFEGCFLRGRVGSNGFKVFNSCIKLILEFHRSDCKKNLRIFCFQKTLLLDNRLPSAPMKQSHCKMLLQNYPHKHYVHRTYQ